jgi:cysteine desulfuration protein SufE
MSAPSIEEKEAELVEDFDLFEDWTEKYQYIIELGQKMESLPETFKTEDNRIKGCQSSVWVLPRLEEGRIVFAADSDSTIVKGLAAMLVSVLSHETPENIVKAELKFIDRIGLSQHLAATRANGLAAMVKQMKLYALAYQGKR